MQRTISLALSLWMRLMLLVRGERGGGRDRGYAFLTLSSSGGKRFSEGTSADREIQRTLMELLNQMDGFDSLGQVRVLLLTETL